MRLMDYNIIYQYNLKLQMFIIIYFGYKLSRVFTIDCLAATLFDCVWVTCIKDFLKLYSSKQELFAKETESHKKRIQKNQKRLEQVEIKLKEQMDANPEKKKQQKKAPMKKGGKEQPVASSPLQQEKFDLVKELEDSKSAIIKYTEKLNKLKQLQTKLNSLTDKMSKEQIFLELVDKTGERKFIKSKLQSQANTFLNDKGSYYLCTVSVNNQEQQVEPLVIDGYPVRTVEQDATVGNEQVFTLAKKDDKNKKGGKKK